MNILFFLTPKSEVSHVSEGASMRQILERMEHHGYTAVPLLSKDGKYIGTITEGDLLWQLNEKGYPTLKSMEEILVSEIPRRRDNKPVSAQANMEDLIEITMNQNFVPVVDDKEVFIGIITRKDVLSYLSGKIKKN